MARPKNPFVTVFTLALIGAIVCAVVRFAYVAHILVQSGESLTSITLKLLLIDVMELHVFALYGAVGGAILGVLLALIDLLRYGGQAEELSWKESGDINPFAKDEVKARRMEAGDRYLDEHSPKGRGGDNK